MRKQVTDAVTIGLFMCSAALIVGLVWRQSSGQERSPFATLSEAERSLLDSGGHLLGSADSPALLIEFGDYQCTYCAIADRWIRSLLSDSAPIAIRFRHLPLTSIHPLAEKAAIAAECAAEQNRFHAYHSRLFELQDSIGKRAWTTIASEVGVGDTTAFAACLDSPSVKDRVREDARVAERLGVRGTPAFVVGTKLYHGLLPKDVVEQLLGH